MRAAGLVVARALARDARPRSPRGHHRRPRRDRPATCCARRAPRRTSSATTASRPSSAPRSTTGSCTASRRRDERLREGDLISIDFGAIVDGWHGDAAVTVAVGAVSPEAQALSAACEAVDVGRARRGPRRRPAGRHLQRRRDERSAAAAATASSPATAATASAPRCTWTRTCSTTGRPARARGWCAGMALAIEPMVTLGEPRHPASSTTAGPSSPWTARSRRTGSTPSRSSRTGPWVLTAEDGGRAELAPARRRRCPRWPTPAVSRDPARSGPNAAFWIAAASQVDLTAGARPPLVLCPLWPRVGRGALRHVPASSASSVQY